MTGATSVLPSARAILSAAYSMTNLCSPSTMCGPFCSVPAVPMMTVVVPGLDEVANLGPGQVFEEHRVRRFAGRRRVRGGVGPLGRERDERQQEKNERREHRNSLHRALLVGTGKRT